MCLCLAWNIHTVPSKVHMAPSSHPIGQKSHMATQLQGRLGNVVLILGSHGLLCRSGASGSWMGSSRSGHTWSQGSDS